MAEILYDIGLDPQHLLLILILTILGVVLLYGRFRFTLLDSLIFFMVAQIANVSVTLTFPMEDALRWQLLLYMAVFWVGFALNGRPLQGASSPPLDRDSFYNLRMLLFVLGTAVLLANLYLGMTAGFPLLSANPSEEKYTVYSSGLGLVRQLNMGPYAFFCAGCSLMIARNVYRRQMALTLAIPTFVCILNGSKGALLPVLFALSFAFSHPGLVTSARLRRRAGLYLGGLMVLAVVLALLVTTKDQGSLVGGFQQLLVRLIYNADVILYYVPRREEIATLIDPHIFGFLDHNVFSGILGLLRISDYGAALGSIIMGTEDRGPNAQYFVQADMFMGPVLGTIYCVIVGYAVGWFRANFMRNRYQSALFAATAFFFALIAFDLAIEVSLFVSEVFITALIVPSLYLLILLFRIAFQDVAKLVPHSRKAEG